MLKLVMCARRLPHLSRAEFDDHWINRHAPLVRSVQDVLGIRRYVQNVPHDHPVAQEALRASRDALPADFDGFGELWWDSLAAQQAARATPAGQAALAALLEDEKRFVDLKRSILWFAEERPII